MTMHQTKYSKSITLSVQDGNELIQKGIVAVTTLA